MGISEYTEVERPFAGLKTRPDARHPHWQSGGAYRRPQTNSGVHCMTATATPTGG